MSTIVSRVKTFLGQPSSHPVNSHSEGQVYEVDPPPDVKKINDSVWEFYSPPEVELNIIFFHGLQVNDYANAFWKTWVARDDDEVIWPKDWLPKKLPKARILSVSYEYAARIEAEGPSDPSILGYTLVQDIIQDEALDIGQNCPVFLVGHSLGGIAIKQFIICAIAHQSKSGRIGTFLKNVKGAFFYATPNNSSEEIDGYFSRLGKSSSILHLLEILSSNTARINKEFMSIAPSVTKIRTFGMAELLSTSFLGFTSVIVTEASARGDVDLFYTNTTADHFSVCKARGPHDHAVIGRLTTFIEDSLA